MEGKESDPELDDMSNSCVLGKFFLLLFFSGPLRMRTHFDLGESKCL